jgi:hypothetical protein
VRLIWRFKGKGETSTTRRGIRRKPISFGQSCVARKKLFYCHFIVQVDFTLRLSQYHLVVSVSAVKISYIILVRC